MTESDVEGYSEIALKNEKDNEEGKEEEEELIDRMVLEHLLFHKAVGEGGIHVGKYLEILREVKEGEHLSMDDPRDRTAAMIFELVLEEGFNPWDIDLKKFARLYLKRMKEELNFITAGRLMLMAYRILRLQSTDLLESLLEQEDDYDESMGIEDWMEDDASYAYTTRVVQSPQPPIEERVTHKGNRRVTLYELVEAFRGAEDEAERMREHNLIMREERRRQEALRKKNRKRVGQRVHDEDYREDIRKVHEVLTKLGRERCTFHELVEVSPVDEVTTFITLLFLNFDEKIRIYQENFPKGEIHIEMPVAPELVEGTLPPIKHTEELPEGAVQVENLGVTAHPVGDAGHPQGLDFIHG